MKVNIDKELLPMKAHYFLFNAGKHKHKTFINNYSN